MSLPPQALLLSSVGQKKQVSMLNKIGPEPAKSRPLEAWDVQSKWTRGAANRLSCATAKGHAPVLTNQVGSITQAGLRCRRAMSPTEARTIFGFPALRQAPLLRTAGTRAEAT